MYLLYIHTVHAVAYHTPKLSPCVLTFHNLHRIIKSNQIKSTMKFSSAFLGLIALAPASAMTIRNPKAAAKVLSKSRRLDQGGYNQYQQYQGNGQYQQQGQYNQYNGNYNNDQQQQEGQNAQYNGYYSYGDFDGKSREQNQALFTF